MDTGKLDGALIRFFDPTGAKIGTIGLCRPAFDLIEGRAVLRPFEQYPNPGGVITSARIYFNDGKFCPVKIGEEYPLRLESDLIIPGKPVCASLDLDLLINHVDAMVSVRRTINSALDHIQFKGFAEVTPKGASNEEEIPSP